MTVNSPQHCQCSCATTQFRTTGPALFRILCHCTICQKFSNAPYADVVVFRAKDVERPATGIVEFDTYKPPPNVQRGKCSACQKPAIEIFESPLFPNLTIVPYAMFSPPGAMPEPVAHIFYEHRISDADDNLPKYRGYAGSQLAFGKYLISAMLRR